MHRIAVIARYALLEARRARLPLWFAAVLAVILAAAFFSAELAVIEGDRVRTAFYAAGVRLAAVFLIATHVIAGISREFHDKGIDSLLALDLPRGHYILGKLAGFVALAVLLALACAAPLLFVVPLAPWTQWTVALALELAVVAAFALLCVVAFGQFLPAAAAVLAFYVLARALGAMQLIAAHPVAGAGTPSYHVMRWLADALALVMPAFDRWPQTAWLVDAPAAWGGFALALGQALAYLILLAAAAVIDFRRRNF
jgi:ABC-type transport system involved in multi-copper enzyme maturation permease subunit